jgi:capsular exopolysaccharide synthesis family protein
MNERLPNPLIPFPAAFQDPRQSLRWAWRLVWRSKYLILACVMLGVVPTFLFLQQVIPRYTAETKIMIQAPETNDALTDRSANLNRGFLNENVMTTEVELITSRTIARRVVAKLRLEEDPEFNRALARPKALEVFLNSLSPLSWLPLGPHRYSLEALSPGAREVVDHDRITNAVLKGLRVAAQRRSYIISVKFTSEDPEKSSLIANTFADMYVLDRLESSFEEAHRITGWLGERLEGLQKDVVTAEAAVERFRSEHNLRQTGERQTTVGDQQLSELNTRLVLARSDLAEKQARLGQVRALTHSRGSVDTSTDVLKSELIQRLREEEAGKSRELSQAMKTYGDRHPRIVGLRADLADLRSKISDEIDKIATSMANDVEVAGAGVNSLQQELDALRRQSNAAGEVTVRLRDLERQAEASKALYETFLTRFKNEAEQGQMRRANARVVSPASIPIFPSYPRSLLIVLLVTLTSFGVGLAIVFLLDRIDNAVRSADEAEELTGLPMLAMIPTHGGDGRHPVETVLQQPRSALADGVRSLRTALLTGDSAEPDRIILITSSEPKEGKTFVSLCLAFMFARTEERVLLIDSDVYRPRLHTILGLDGERGLAQVLAGELPFEEVVQHNVRGALDFLPAGRHANLTEILQGPQLEALFARLSVGYTRVIIDSPPVLAVADVRTLARLADRVIYLVKWSATARDAVRNGIKLLRSAGGKLHGVVLSQVDQRRHSRYGYRDYGQYYGRYREYYGE